MTIHDYYTRGGKRTKTMSDQIKFEKNQPQEVTLAYATGKPGSNQYGDFYTYTTTDDRVFFAAPALNQKIQNQILQFCR
jgi:hypothetical protein